MRTSSLDELRQLCRGIRKSFVHLETRDSYGTETELPHLARWRRGEPDDYAWLERWLEMLREHRTAGRTCRRARVVSEPLSEYQQWVLSSAALFAGAGEDIGYVPRPRLTMTSLPGSGDFYVFDASLVMFLHYAGNGTNTAFEITDEPQATRACQEAFESAWQIATRFVSTVPRSPTTQARRELGLRLRQIRKTAGLTGQMLADATGQHFTRISRIENGAQPPTDRNIQDWCTACGAEDQIPDLVATARVAESAYLDWARQSRAGLKHLGTLHSIATYRRTTTFRIHEPIVLPGIFQTEAYIRRMLAYWYDFLHAPDDTDATVAMKAERTAIALSPAKRIDVVLGEQALHTRYGSPAEHAGQLSHVLSLMRLPFVSVAVIPAGIQRRAIATIGFWIFDENAVALETPTAAIKITRPNEIAQYAAMFGHLHHEAVHGHQARQLIAVILAGL